MKTVARVRISSVARIAPIVSWLIGMAASGLLVLRLISAGTFDTADLISAGLLPLVYAVVGLALGIAGAWLYNLVAGWVGGIEIELED
jgi:hypothetical protein